MMRAIHAEFQKLKGSKVPLWTFLATIAYGAIAIAGAFAMKTGAGETAAALGKAGGAWAQAAALGRYDPTWENMLRQNTQGIAGAWGILLFGFVTAYVFGRERKEGTNATMLTSPVQRRSFAVAKMVVIAVWCLALTLFSFIFQTVGMAPAGLSGFAWVYVFRSLGHMLQAAALFYMLLPLVALVALIGKPGYLKPMVFAAFLNLIGLMFAGEKVAGLIPGAMPILLDGASWMPIVKAELSATSWMIAVAVFVVGMATLMWTLGRASDSV
jgi:ABC-type transport system involved in multi-copper enzyme maturation permease subunit